MGWTVWMIAIVPESQSAKVTIRNIQGAIHRIVAAMLKPSTVTNWINRWINTIVNLSRMKFMAASMSAPLALLTPLRNPRRSSALYHSNTFKLNKKSRNFFA